MSKNSSISKIVKEIEVKKLKELYQEFNDVITLISNFIIKKKLILCNTIFNKHEFEMYNRGVIVDPPYPCECYFGNSCSKGIPCMTYITPQTIVKAVTSLS